MLNRRRAVSMMIGGVSSCFVPVHATEVNEERRSLRLKNIHTNDECDVTYFTNDSYQEAEFLEICYLMRDHRTGHISHIDTRLIDALHKISTRLSIQAPVINVLSGYRTAMTNQYLARSNKRVAKNSYHLVGRAVDFNIDGVSVNELTEVAVSQRIGGVGSYDASGFIHIDTGPLRRW